MIIEGLLTAMMSLGQPTIPARARVRYYKRVQVKKKSPPEAIPTDTGPRTVRSLTCHTAICSTFDEMWADRVLQWSVK